MEAFTAVSSPWSYWSEHWAQKALFTSICAFSSASLKRVFWNAATLMPNALRSCTYWMVRSSMPSHAATEPSARIRRSRGSSFIRLAKPRPSPPRIWSTPTRTFSKNSSEVSAACWPIFSRLRPRAKPGSEVSTVTRLMPREPAFGSVLQASTITSQCWPLVIKVFWPLITRESPSRSARVFIDCRSEPAPGSVMPMAPTASPETIFGSQVCFCSSLPRCRMYGATMSECTERFEARPLKPMREASSTTMDDRRKLAPKPPYSSGTSTHSRPFSPILFQISRGVISSFSHCS